MQRPVSSIADNLFYSTVYIETKTLDGGQVGTGFLINYPVTAGNIVPVLVTNKHVLLGAYEAEFRLVRAEGNDPAQGAVKIKYEGFGQDSWLGHPAENVDVAVMLFAPIWNRMVEINAPGFYRAFSPENLLDQRNSFDLDAIEQVTFLGYPAGLYDSVSMLPIARRGQTATPIYIDYNGLPAFLIDAAVFPGSSGSPVVIFDNGLYVARNGAVNLGQSRFFLVGIVAAVHTREISGEISITTTGSIASFREPIGLGIVYKSSAIQECVDILFANAGVVSEGAPSPDALA
ncbi:Trypsin-like peptidase domain-containing protein [Micrococcales bacterium KH10]|nr:Trypsin-like peptidase domain-containing protein [Micrococcales bacterium KH10]